MKAVIVNFIGCTGVSRYIRVGEGGWGEEKLHDGVHTEE